MVNKILIIGQAPPLKKQTVPYDTTLLYDMLSWIGITKDAAQTIFEFEALTDVFPGKNKFGAHLPPTKEQVTKYWADILKGKVINSEKVILLGNVPVKYFVLFTRNWAVIPAVIELPHPSRRNYTRIMNRKGELSKQLSDFIFDP